MKFRHVNYNEEGKEKKPYTQLMWDVKKQRCGGSYMAASWRVCKVNNLVCQLRRFQILPTCIYYYPTIDKELSYCLLFKLLESKLCSLFNLQTESAIVMASHGYILGAHMNKRTLPNNVIYIIDKMKANQECSSNENS